MVGFATVTQTGKRVAADFSAKNVTFMAAGIAYNAFVSLAPLLVLLLFVTSLVGSDVKARLVALADTSLPGPIATVVTQVFQGRGGVAGASVVGLVVLLWGTLKIFRGLDTAFSEIYETTAKNSLTDQVIDGVVVLVALLVALVAMIGVTVVFDLLSAQIPYIGYLTPVILVAGLMVAFFPIYYRFPDADVGWRDVLPGVVVAAVGWAALQALFQVYLSLSGDGAGELFGGVIVVITWLYFSGLVLLVGAVINAVVGGHSSGKAGGVGTGASGYETTHDESLPRDAFAEYLTDLRAELTGYDAGTRPFAQPKPGDRYLPSNGDVRVIEQTKSDGETRQWAVSVRWEQPEPPRRRADREA